MNENEETLERQPLEISPENATSLEDWRELALKLRDRVQKLTTEEKKRVGQLRILRKDVKRKDKALGYYKKVIRELELRIEELETRIEDCESGVFFRLRKFTKQYSRRKNDSQVN